MSPRVTFALIVVASTTLLDQLVDYLLVPRVLGSSLNLHPVMILIGAIVGASLAGVIGLLLSAPATATLLLAPLCLPQVGGPLTVGSADRCHATVDAAGPAAAVAQARGRRRAEPPPHE